MTGYGRSNLVNDAYDITLELKTVNNRHKDIGLRLPKNLIFLDNKIREKINKRLNRGKIDVFLNFKTLGESNTNIILNEELAKQYSKVLESLMSVNTMIKDDIDLQTLVSFPDVITIEEKALDENLVESLMLEVLDGALDELIKSREKEGNNLKQDINTHLLIVEKLTKNIKEYAPTAFEISKQKLKERIQKNLEDIALDENRLLTEIAILADKLAIDEEIARIESHLKDFNETIEIDDQPIGRRLDFLIQELNREVNTIGSKTDNIDISKIVIELKSEIEKLREQVQNVE